MSELDIGNDDNSFAREEEMFKVGDVIPEDDDVGDADERVA